MEEKFTFFWESESPFSQWHPSIFLVQGVKYNCAEQFMMAEKARLFKDEETLKKIMATNSPREQKKLGREVANFDANIWEKKAEAVVYTGNMAKFTQNMKMLDVLLKTKGTTLTEASPYDKIYGIGLTADDPKAQKRETWQGKNLLGEILTKVRDAISSGGI